MEVEAHIDSVCLIGQCYNITITYRKLSAEQIVIVAMHVFNIGREVLEPDGMCSTSFRCKEPLKAISLYIIVSLPCS